MQLNMFSFCTDTYWVKLFHKVTKCINFNNIHSCRDQLSNPVNRRLLIVHVMQYDILPVYVIARFGISMKQH